MKEPFTFLIIGIIAAACMVACDIILLGQPVAGWTFDPASFEAMEHVSLARAAIGAFGGMLFCFLSCFGFVYVASLFSDRKAFVFLSISFSAMMFFSGVFHGSYFFLYNTDHHLPAEVIHRFRLYLLLPCGLAGISGFAGSIYLFVHASHQKFPRWYRWCNPSVLIVLFFGLLYILPAPVGGYIRPAFINLATLTFFGLTGLLVSRGIRPVTFLNCKTI